MRLTVADLESTNDPTSSSSISLLSGFEDDTANILYVPLPASIPPGLADNSVVELPPWALRNRLTILGVHHWRRNDITEDAMDDIARRVPDAPLYLLVHDDNGRPELKHVRGGPVTDLDHAALIDCVRNADLLTLLQGSGANLAADGLLHYQGPNGHHYGAFMRPGFALTTTSALDRVGFWLLPAMQGRSNIVVDHWSMLGAAHHISTYAKRFYGGDEDTFVEALRGYGEDRDVLTGRLRRAFPEPTTDKAIFLLSINSSGHMAHATVLPALEGADQVGAVAYALAAAPPGSVTPVESLAQLDDAYRRYHPDDCPYCNLGRTVIPIEHDTYLLRLAAYTQITAITQHDAWASTTVIEAYKGLGAFSVHKEHIDGRHHAFYVDVLPMLDTERFTTRLQAAVNEITDVQPQAILHPPTEAASLLAQKVAAQLGLGDDTVISTMERGLPQLPSLQKDLLCDATDILIVDDVVITGRRIEGYRQQLIALRRQHDRSGEVNLGCVVGVARARDAKALKGSKDFVHHRANSWRTFAAAETLHLPNWDKRDCPWCLELRMLNDLGDDVKAHPIVSARIAALQKTEGLSQIFLPWPSTNETEVEPAADRPEITEAEWKAAGRSEDTSARYAERFWELNPGSVFGHVQGADLVVSVAAAVHSLRSKTTGSGGVPVEPRLDTRFRSPVSKVLDPDLYLLGRFYEPVLIASILRASRAWDVRSPDGDDQLSDAVGQQLTYLTSGERLAGELLIMAALGHLPARSVTGMSSQSAPNLQPVIDALIAAARRVDGAA